MSRSFIAASSQYLETQNNPFTVNGAAPVLPFSMACWFKLFSSVNSGFMFVGHNNVPGSFQGYLLDYVASGPSLRAAAGGTLQYGQAQTTAPPPIGVWNHGCAVFASDTSRSVYLNGANKATDTITVGQNVLIAYHANIGVYYWNAGRISYCNGLIAHAALWYGIALSDSDIAALARGVSPWLIHPDYLTHYWPLRGLDSPERNVALRLQNPNANALFNMTLNNNPGRGEEPPLWLPLSFRVMSTLPPAPPVVSVALPGPLAQVI